MGRKSSTIFPTFVCPNSSFVEDSNLLQARRFLLHRYIFQSSGPMTFPRKTSLKKSLKMQMEPKLRQKKLVNVGQQPKTKAMDTVVPKVTAMPDTVLVDSEVMASADMEVMASADMEVMVMDTNTCTPLAWIITRLNTITESACGVWLTKIRLSKTHTLATITTKKTMEKLPRQSINYFLTMPLFFMFFRKE